MGEMTLETAIKNIEHCMPSIVVSDSWHAIKSHLAQAVEVDGLLQLIRDARHRICNDAPGPRPFDHPVYGPLLRRLDAADSALAHPHPTCGGEVVPGMPEPCNWHEIREKRGNYYTEAQMRTALEHPRPAVPEGIPASIAGEALNLALEKYPHASDAITWLSGALAAAPESGGG